MILTDNLFENCLINKFNQQSKSFLVNSG